MLISDLAGGVGGVLLAIPPVKDQFYRYKRSSAQRREANSSWPGLRKVVKEAWETRRNDYDGVDSLFTLAGAAALALSFALKLVDA